MNDLSKHHICQRPPGVPEGGIPCRRCNGTGVLYGSNYLKCTYCPDCNGFGFLTLDGKIISIPMRLLYAWKNCLMPISIILLGIIIAFIILATFPDYLITFFAKKSIPLTNYQIFIRIGIILITTVIVLLFSAFAWKLQMKPNRRPYKNYTLIFMIIYILLYLCIVSMMLFNK